MVRAKSNFNAVTKTEISSKPRMSYVARADKMALSIKKGANNMPDQKDKAQDKKANAWTAVSQTKHP